jgi:PadR family transcriptional regulator PadR
MEAEGLIKSFETEPLPERGGRPRKYYELTAEGLRRAREEASVVSGLYGLSVPEGILR